MVSKAKWVLTILVIFYLPIYYIPLLNKTEGARIATTSSLAHERGRIDFDNLNAEKSYSKIGSIWAK